MSQECQETCPTCMGSGYSNHPDSGEICQKCGGSGGIDYPTLKLRVKVKGERAMTREYNLDIWQNGEWCAGVSGSDWERVHAEAMRYAMVYERNGPIEIRGLPKDKMRPRKPAAPRRS